MTFIDPERVITFWGPTAASPRFVEAPVLRWQPTAPATRYEVAVADPERVVWRTSTTAAEVDLVQAWPALPLGAVDVLVRGFDDDDHEVSVRGHRRFWRVPGFDGALPPAADWEGAVHRAIDYLLGPARDRVYDYEAEAPRSVWSSFEDSATGLRGQLGFPSLHNPSFVLALLAYADRFPTAPAAPIAERQALAYGRWLVDHVLPDGWRCAGLSPSTVERGRVGGLVEGGNITLFRSARVGEAMLRLFAHTGDDVYLRRARRIAAVLLELQQDNGSWPYRVDPKTGAIADAYTSAAITPIRLFAMLEPLGDDADRLRAARQRAETWLLNGPISDGRWEGMYEDVPAVEPWTNLQNWDTNETIRYLLGPDCELPDRVAHAEALNAYIEDQFVVWRPEESPVQVRCPTPAVIEQYRCYHPMEVHTGNWLASLLALHRATGDDRYRAKGVAAANAIVAGQHDHGALSTWGFDTRFGTPLQPRNWPGCNAVAVSALLHWSAYQADPVGYRPSAWAV
ncbi:hypothetical protein [Microlunatus speluncae]|uniref:hypothetical protein n=1 Tax=Microlunatus speluncae TaxID=2594267 RepID=UPI0012663B60|nr:hypothetical protein [Microlunatus speluncae]